MKNKKIIKEWVDALRSGEYKQGYLQLRSDSNNFCVFGVFADIVQKQGNKKLRWEPMRVGGYTLLYDDGKYGGPDAYQIPLAIWPYDEEYMRQIYVMNDEMRLTFEQLANWIEENLGENSKRLD